MNHQAVVSTNLRSVGHDPTVQILEVEFHNGGVYHYFVVPEAIYLGLMAAGSKGGYLADRVKGVYRYQRVGWVRR